MLHPITALNQVIDEYRDHLRSEFRAKDSRLKDALERELDRPLFLAQEPFFQAHRPFLSGRRWDELPIDRRLARVMEQRSGNVCSYRHQSEAITRLLSPDPGPVVVTTGTGSGKTEAFLLPVIQNALEDAVRFKRAGLTAILLYPMNALANDQLIRIQEYLRSSGFEGAVSVKQYDRSTRQAEREAMRRNPPHILLTNYMMLEYLLVRPADREDIFANHRCRFLVLDEVHTYRGTLGSNIALLVRRLRAHLARARQDWNTEVNDADRPLRFPRLVPIGTSATIKSVAEEGLSSAERIQLRDEAVQGFFSALAGVPAHSIQVLGEELESLEPPPGAIYPPTPAPLSLDTSNPEAVRSGICTLSAESSNASFVDAANGCRLLWDLNRWLVAAPLSVSQIVSRLKAEVADRATWLEAEIRAEVEAALALGAALPDGTPGALRLRVHRFIRGGWKFHRCVQPACGRLYPMGEERCECGHVTAPLFLCRNCGADYLRLVGNPEQGTLRPLVAGTEDPEWLLYEPRRFANPSTDDEDFEDDEAAPPRGRSPHQPTQIKNRPVLHGSFDPVTLAFSTRQEDYPVPVSLSPARTRCLCCGGRAGSRNVITAVSLGTSAAVKVLSEGTVEALATANSDREGHDGKERLLIFSDSRQDAAHQARFIIFASRYDRMRRRVLEILSEHGSLTIQRIVEFLGNQGCQSQDNPYAPNANQVFIPPDLQERIRAWEEAPLLDDLAVAAGYRGTLFNLGLVRVEYQGLDTHVQTHGGRLADLLGISVEHLAYVSRCILDELRTRSCLSRDMLRYHPLNPACPRSVRTAEWERRIAWPQGLVANPRDAEKVPHGIKVHKPWRGERAGGSNPMLQQVLKHLQSRLGGVEPSFVLMSSLLDFLAGFINPVHLFGAREKASLLQVNADVLLLRRVQAGEAMRCGVCSRPMCGTSVGFPCPRCHGNLVQWAQSDIQQHRSVRRLQAPDVVPLVAQEHTAQIPNDVRFDIEGKFKSAQSESRLNVLACSPTLEMGIDVGGLDAVILRNVPPRPDNYAQRGGRAGRRTRVGLVLGYARNAPHDQYFYDRPAEMISGEVPAPALALGNRDVILRHLNAIAFGAAEPGLAGKMVEYVSAQGEIHQDRVDALIAGLRAQTDYALAMAQAAWGEDVLTAAGMDETVLRAHLAGVPDLVQDVINRTARQVRELRTALDQYAAELVGMHAARHAGDMVAGLLGIRDKTDKDADDYSAGYPLRRFAEFGVLPGYEFPTEPATLRLLGDPNEEQPLSVARIFGISQYQPDASVYARTRRWRTIGLDTSSPWNPQNDGPGWLYNKCRQCHMRFSADQPRCPRCTADKPGKPLSAGEFGGFIARRDESPILDEEDRIPAASYVETHPQWDGIVSGRWLTGPGWSLRWSCREEVRWLNEGRPPSPKELHDGYPVLHQDARGFVLCGVCGHLLSVPPPAKENRGRKQPQRNSNQEDPYSHAADCARRGTPPDGMALVATQKSEVLRLLVPVPDAMDDSARLKWGLTLGYSLRIGMRHLYMLDGAEIEFALEGPWKMRLGESDVQTVSLSFIDPSLGGSGYLPRIASDLHLVARRTLEHLDHPVCEKACYRCLKSYRNQRHHELLEWPLVIPDLEALAGQEPVSRPLSGPDIDDPRPWLEAYAAGVGSPLELRFLRLFEQHGFHPDKQVPISPTDSHPISIADFAVPSKRLAIYIDGAAFHTGSNLRRDRYIRERLRNGTPTWLVQELAAPDLAQGAALVARLKEIVDTVVTPQDP